jgi:hypothetical protein
VRFEDITDGLSNTLLIGEKHVPIGKWGIGWWDCSTYNGDYYPCSTRSAGPNYPLAQSLNDPGWKFGSYHPGICQFALCDGSVRPIPVTIDLKVLGWLANRSDGQIIPDF